jgi:hypothetical protein
MRRIITVLSVSACILIGAGCKMNRAPATPGAPVGPEVGMAGESLNFLVVTTDPDLDSVRYRVDWGDALGDWTGFLASAESCNVGHAWFVRDTYSIEVLAEDVHGRQSEWSVGHVVSIESLCRR